MEKGVAMTPDIKERLSELIGELPAADYMLTGGYSFTYGKTSGGCATFKDKPMYEPATIETWRTQLIEKLTKDARVLLHDKDFAEEFYDSDGAEFTHTVICLDMQPIRKGVTKNEILKFLKSKIDMELSFGNITDGDAKDLADRIEKEGIV